MGQLALLAPEPDPTFPFRLVMTALADAKLLIAVMLAIALFHVMKDKEPPP